MKHSGAGCSRLVAFLAAVFGTLALASPAWSQRITVPSRVNGFTNSGGSYSAPYSAYPPAVSGWDPYAQGDMAPPVLQGNAPPYVGPGNAPAGPVYGGPGSTLGYGPPGYGPPSYGQPSYGPSTYGPPASSAPGFGSPYAYPGSAYGGSPYANPGYGVPAGPSGGYGATPAQPEPWGGYAGRQVKQALDVLQEFRVRNTYLAGNAGDDLKMQDIEASVSFAVPFMFNPQPLLITPGFGIHFWDGPDTALPGDPDLPGTVYDAYLQASWAPEITPWLTADLAFSAGVATDFDVFNKDSYRFRGRGLAILRFNQQTQLAAGVWYLDRNSLKLLPAGGIIWMPNQDTRFELLFPNPRITRRLTTVGNTDWWWYLSGELGGGAWTMQRLGGLEDNVEYDDLRASFGFEWVGYRGKRTFFEVGYVFDRKVKFESLTPDFKPDDTYMFRGGIVY